MKQTILILLIVCLFCSPAFPMPVPSQSVSFDNASIPCSGGNRIVLDESLAVILLIAAIAGNGDEDDTMLYLGAGVVIWLVYMTVLEYSGPDEPPLPPGYF